MLAALATQALTHLGPHGHPLAREALPRATLTLLPSTHHWDSSYGPVAAHPVSLRVDAALLGALCRSPGGREALVAALSAALSDEAGVTLERLDLGWDGTVRTEAPSPYRGAPGIERGDTDTGRRDALGAYLGAEHPEARQWIAETAGVGLDAQGRWCVRGGKRTPTEGVKRALDEALRALTDGAAKALRY